MRRTVVLTVALVLAACGSHDEGDGSATCADVASAAAGACDVSFDEPACSSTCESMGHPGGHLSTALGCVEDAADCDAVLDCLAVDEICS